MLGDDEDAFLNYLDDSMRATLIMPVTGTTEVRTLDRGLPSSGSDKGPSKVLIWNPRFIIPVYAFQQLPTRRWDEASQSIRTHETTEYRIAVDVAPVIEFIRSRKNRDALLVQGRLWAATNVTREYLSEKEHQQFKAWCDAILRWVRRTGKHIKGQDGYFFPMAAEAFKNKTVHFAV
jgi:hypothetical protein